MTQRLRVFIIFFVARFVRHRFKAGAVGALTNLTNQRPSREQRSERCHVVQSSLKRQSLLLRFLWATVKCEKIGVRSSVKDLILCHWRLILRSNRTFARLQESGYLREILRQEGFAEGGHVHAAVYDADDDVAFGKFIAYVSQIWPATAAIAIDQVAIETAFVAKEFCAGEHWAGRSTNYFFRQRLRVEVRRPRRVCSGNPQRADHNYAEQHHRDRPWPPRWRALTSVVQYRRRQQNNADDHRCENHHVAFDLRRDQREQREGPKQIPVRPRVGIEDAGVRRGVELWRPDKGRKQGDHHEHPGTENEIPPGAFGPEWTPGLVHPFFIFGSIGCRIDYHTRNRRLGDAVAQHQHEMYADEKEYERGHDENMDGEKAAQRCATDRRSTEDKLRQKIAD